MANAFSLVTNIDYKKLNAVAKEDSIFIGFPSGMVHAETGEDIAEIAKKQSFGAGPQTWVTKKRRVIGFTKSGKPRLSKTPIEKTHHVSGIPARPFLEDGIYHNLDEVNRACAAYYKKKFKTGWIPREGIHALAVTVIGAIQKFVRSGYYKATKPNSPATIRAKETNGKGGDIPLIDTAQMINSLTYVIDQATYQKTKNEETGKKEWTAN